MAGWPLQPVKSEAPTICRAEVQHKLSTIELVSRIDFKLIQIAKMVKMSLADPIDVARIKAEVLS